jgi:hypothetical protein
VDPGATSADAGFGDVTPFIAVADSVDADTAGGV